MSPLITEKDVRRLLQLLGRLATLPQNVHVRCRNLLHEVCGWLDAEAAVWQWLGDDGEEPCSPIVVGWATERQRARLQVAAQQARAAIRAYQVQGSNLLDATFLRCGGPVVESPETAALNGRCIFAVYPLPERQCLSCVSIHRIRKRHGFTDDQRRLLAILWGELGWLHRTATDPEQHGPPLPFRLQQTLECLLSGRSTKETAQAMGISPLTVNGYVKELHRRLGVCSRGELLAKWIR